MNISQINIDSILNLTLDKKKDLIEELNTLIQNIDNERSISKIGFALVDNFKDENIETILTKLITDPYWKNKNGTFLYLLGEYTNDSKYLCFLIDLVLKNWNDGEILMSGYSMILNLHPPFERKDITKSLRRLKAEKKKKNINNERIQLVHSLIDFLEGQRGIIKFYSQFGKK